MTLLVGILCKDGAVIAADKQTTHGSGLSGITVGHSSTKITSIKNKILIASSGHRGLGQQFSAAVETLADGFDRQKNSVAAINVQNEFRKLTSPAFAAASAAVPLVGAQAAQADVICGSLLAARFLGGVSIIEVTPMGAVEFLSPDLPFLCLGSGKRNADPFLGFLWSVYFGPDSSPTVAEGSLLAYWTIKTGIKLASTGVGFGVDVFLLNPQRNPQVQEVSDDELNEHEGFIREAENSMRSVRDSMKKAEDAVPPPKPAAQ